MLTWICTIVMNRAAETKKFDKTAKYEVLAITSSKVMSKKRYFYKFVFLYIKKTNSAGDWNTLFKHFSERCLPLQGVEST